MDYQPDLTKQVLYKRKKHVGGTFDVQIVPIFCIQCIIIVHFILMFQLASALVIFYSFPKKKVSV